MAQTFDPYRALGVRRDATDSDVKAAHRKLAKRFHPDTDGGDHDKFLRVQEAYKVLSDPLLRREWDARHAPGPVRADRSAAASQPVRPRTTPRRPPRPANPPAEQAAADADPAESAARQPRSSRAYTWSAAEVPWWEEGASENRRQPGRKRPARPKSPTPPTGAAEPPQSPAAAHAEQTNPFDVYNRSSGAAWSMAARAYFRRGDQELPRRGQFQYEGTQVLTGARARAYTEAEARRRAAQASRPQPTASTAATAAAAGAAAFTYTASGVSHDAHRIHEVRQTWRRRTSAVAWPSLQERLLYALLAWIPAAIVIGYSGALVTGCDPTLNNCPAYLESAQAVAIALVLGLLVALPKIAYIGAMAAIGAFVVGLVLVGILAVSGVELPLSRELIALLGITLGLAYAATVGVVLLLSPRSRPWFTGGVPAE